MARIVSELIYKLIADETDLVKGIADSKKEIQSLEKELENVDKRAKVWGASTKDLAEKQALLKAEINRLISSGIDPEGKAVLELKASYDRLGTELADAEEKTASFAREQKKLKDDHDAAIKKAKEHSEAVKKLGKDFTDSGKKLTVGLTVPIVAAGTAMVKLASDTGESLNAANVVFKESGKTIEAWGKNAATQAGLTAAEFYQASAVIGAGLTNAGASAEQAAKQTIDLTKRAADMASIFNTSVDDALGALQAGLRGESEPLRRFAVSLDAVTIEAKAVAMGMVDGAGKATAYGLSQARLAIIMEQSAKFQGDFANTSGGLANSMRITTAMVKEQAAQLGEQLLPLVLDVVKGIQGAVSWFSQLSDEQKKAILITAGVAAAIGPVLIGIGQMITAVNTLSVAMKAIQAAGGGPVALAIAGIGALVAAFVALNAIMNEQRKKQDELEFGQVAKDMGITASNAGNVARELQGIMPLFANIYSDASNIQYFTEAWKQNVDETAKKYGVTREQAVLLLQSAKDITQEQKNTIAALEEQIKLEALNKQFQQARQAGYKGSLEAFKEEIRIQTEKFDKQAAQEKKAREDKVKSEQDKAKAVTDAETKKQESIKATNELIDQTIAKEKTEKDILLENIATLEAAKGISDTKRLEALKILQAQVASINQAEKDAAIKTKEDETAAALALEEKKTADAKAESDKRVAEQKKAIDDTIKYAEFASNAIFGFAQQLTKNQSMELDNRTIREKDAINNSTKTEEEKAEAIKAIDKKVAHEKAIIARDQAIWEKAQAIVSIGISTAKAVAETLANPILATAIGIAGAAQAAAVLAQPLPEIPSFANGGSFMVPQGFNNDTFPLPAAMVQSGERVTVETPEQQRQGKAVFQIGTVIASPDGYRELKRQIEKYGAVEELRRGK